MLKIDFTKTPPTEEDIQKERNSLKIKLYVNAFLIASLAFIMLGVFGYITYPDMYVSDKNKWIFLVIFIFCILIVALLIHRNDLKERVESFCYISNNLSSGVERLKELQYLCNIRPLYLKYVQSVLKGRNITFYEIDCIESEIKDCESKKRIEKKRIENEKQINNMKNDILKMDGSEHQLES